VAVSSSSAGTINACGTMLVRRLRRVSSLISEATDLVRGMRQGIFGYTCRPLPDETLKYIFLCVYELTRDEWDQRVESEQEIVYLGLTLSHVSRQWRGVALQIPSLWSGIRICQSDQPETSAHALPERTRHFLRCSSFLLIDLTVSADNHHILCRLPTHRIRSLVIFGTFEAIYDASEHWEVQFPALTDLFLEVSPPQPPIHGFQRPTPIVDELFFDSFPSMTWLTLRNIDCICPFQHIANLCRLTWTMDAQCELDSMSFIPFYDLTDIHYLELDVPNLIGGPFHIARPVQEAVFKNAGTTVLNALNCAFSPNLTSLTITSSENLTLSLLSFLERPRGGQIRMLSLSLVGMCSHAWYQILQGAPNVETLELGLTPTPDDPDPLNEVMDALAVHLGDVILVPRLAELRLAGDVSGIERVVDFLRVRSVESELDVTQRIVKVKELVLPTRYFTLLPEPFARELKDLVVVSADAALNRLVKFTY
jgi:hypothetical protein